MIMGEILLQRIIIELLVGLAQGSFVSGRLVCDGIVRGEIICGGSVLLLLC